jgi:hypothetical protein
VASLRPDRLDQAAVGDSSSARLRAPQTQVRPNSRVVMQYRLERIISNHLCNAPVVNGQHLFHCGRSVQSAATKALVG